MERGAEIQDGQDLRAVDIRIPSKWKVLTCGRKGYLTRLVLRPTVACEATRLQKVPRALVVGGQESSAQEYSQPYGSRSGY